MSKMKYFGIATLILIVAMMSGCGSGHHGITDTGGDTNPTVGSSSLVPAGEFSMGSSMGLFDTAESPLHTVELDSFYIQVYEVTNEQYADFLSDPSIDGVAHYYALMDIDQYGEAYQPALGLNKYPVRYVTWDDAVAYAEWIGGWLPTEAQWEKASRGPNDTRIFPWGDTISAGLCNFSNSLGGLWEVGKSSGTSYYGCYDIVGNVWEWVADWYDDNYYNQSPSYEPTGPLTGEYRVLRGGSYLDNEYSVRCAKRSFSEPGERYAEVGFRCAMATADTSITE